MKIKDKFSQGISLRQLAIEYNLSRKTVRKYSKMNNPKEEVIYDKSNRGYSQLDKYKDKIIQLSSVIPTVTEIKVKLEEYHNVQISYSSLNYYIRKHKLKKPINQEDQTNAKDKTAQCIRILRSKIIKYILSWNLNKNELETIETNLTTLVTKYNIINIFKQFYENFKNSLTNKDSINFKAIMETPYENIVIKRFIKSLMTDYDAVINSAMYNYSNGCVEGNVNKLKKIKRDMYGRAKVNLLRNKVIYQSLYF